MNKIPLSSEAKFRLINQWGPEVILVCKCAEVPSHSMWGQYGSAKCPKCKQICETLFEDWSIIQDGS